MMNDATYTTVPNCPTPAWVATWIFAGSGLAGLLIKLLG